MENSDHHHSGALIIGSNEDLLTEILIRLPVTSILRFKSVSKHWRSLLTHTHFTHRHDNNINVSKSVGVFGSDDIYVPYDVENRSPPPFRSLELYFNRSHVTIKQSCNGLLLCRAFHNDASEYYVFNPTTKQLAFIPLVPKYVRSMALALHQTECVHYKVVCVYYLKLRKNMFQIQVYSSETRKWKICIESIFAHPCEFYHPVYWNGAVHWAPGYLDNNFLYFKLDVEELQMLPVPEELVSAELSTMYFGESRGHLHLISETNRKDGISSLNVYEMLRDRSGWFIKYRVPFDDLPGSLYKVTYESGVLDVVRGKEEEETFLVVVTPGKVTRYNVHDKSFNEIYSLTDDDDFYQRSSFHRYIETLSSF
ncbi:F-box protein At5g07610-like [Bidens hawaiensis]|uniref:F-box protein At5g07610-like n=1 Tax=Bidens hawaiensis TaxID=980011 RepID=UPI004049D0CF